MVAAGSYVENIRFAGRDIVLRSQDGPEVTTIDGSTLPRAVIEFELGESNACIIEGFRITGGSGSGVFEGERNGGGIWIQEAEPSIIGNIIEHNDATAGSIVGLGGGIYCRASFPNSELPLRAPKIIGNTIRFNCTSVALVWSGANNGTWDITTANNWTVEGVPTTYADPKQVVFSDSATGQTNVTISGIVQPESVTLNTTTNPYTITSSAGNNLAGNVRFGKRGPGAVSLAGGANANTGVTTLRGGTLIVSTLANGGSPSDIGAASGAAANLVFNGGALQYIGGAASIDRLFTVGTSGGAIDVAGTGALTLNNSGNVSLGGTLTLTGSTADTNTLVSTLIAGGGLNKSGSGTWVLTGANTFGGVTTIGNGVLQIGAGGGSGTLGGGSVINNAALVFNRSGTVTTSGAISGTGTVTKEGTGTAVLLANNSYAGGTAISAGTLQLGNGGPSGSLNSVGSILNDSVLDFNTSGTHQYSGAGLISGIGNVIVRGGGLIKVIGANSYTGWTRIDAGATFQPCEGNTGQLLSSAVTNNGTLRLVRQDTGVFIYTGPVVGSGRVQVGANNFNAGNVTLVGSNTYSGGTFIGCNELVLGDGVNPGAGGHPGRLGDGQFRVQQGDARDGLGIEARHLHMG